jgi:hypothetical protein
MARSTETVFDEHNQKDAASPYATTLGYRSDVGFNGREIRRWLVRGKSAKAKSQQRKPQGFK